MDYPQVGEEYDEDIEYVVEKLDTDEEESMEEMGETQEQYKEDAVEADEKREIDHDLCAQLQSDDENSEPVIKKIKLSEVIYFTHKLYLYNRVPSSGEEISLSLFEQPCITFL